MTRSCQTGPALTDSRPLGVWIGMVAFRLLAAFLLVLPAPQQLSLATVRVAEYETPAEESQQSEVVACRQARHEQLPQSRHRATLEAVRPQDSTLRMLRPHAGGTFLERLRAGLLVPLLC